MKKRYLVLFLSGIVLMNACLKEHSLENGNGPSQGTLQDDGTGDCFPKNVVGAYVVGTALSAANNYIDVVVDVTQPGTYTIKTDTVNGMHFRTSGVFSAIGLDTVRLQGFGTPAAIEISNFNVTYGSSVCTVAVNVVGSLAVFTLDGAPGACMNATLAGTYNAGTVLDATNTLTIHVTVTTAGAYSISTAASNGIVFNGSGTLSVGAQTIVLSASGSTPTQAGPTTIPVTIGGTSCSYQFTVGGISNPATYTVDCATATVQGTYTVGTALDPATNKVLLTVSVATAGTYSITATVNGMTFNGSGTFAATGPGQTVTLVATAASIPTTPGANTVQLTGGTANCSFTVNVNPAGGGAAVYTVDCTTANVQGTYTVGAALDPVANKVVVTVNVTTPGTYTINATANGMTFTGTGTFATAGSGQTVTLSTTAASIPTTPGANVVQLTGGTANCSFNVNVNPAGGGAAVFTVNCGSATINGTYTQGTALGGSNTVTIPVNVTTAGTYNVTTTATNGMTFSSGAGTWAVGAQTLTLTGSGTPNASGTIYITVNAGTTPCNFMVLVVAPSTLSDYFPRTTNSTWSYEFDDAQSDSLINKVIAATHTALGNTYNVFVANDGTGFDTSGYWRRSGSDYYHYVDLAAYLGVDNIQRVEFIFLKDNQNPPTEWTSAPFSVMIQGNPAMLRIRFKVIQRDVPISITSSLGTIVYPNTIVIEEHYEADPGTGYISLDTIIGYYKDYYSRNIGWIKDEYIDDMGNLSSIMELRRFVVY